ncbi:hypothetical protein dsx2_0798 [Desulfovibrio sp. X2]|uniref:NifB/NifX family molybdenum-iron cluster-binding protein n=1 Tax=Desulfovibrio sp. X2 TaxID=941449 RepID=UPI000358F4E6|nr:hypothetical protein [Desulfovibrio sp. X2]EPR37452.1 hypothetical protein dsx2_0798 [Desulfovibrio sp. X2]
MARNNVLVPLLGDAVAPRFDQALELLLLRRGDDGEERGRDTVLLDHASADGLCDFILRHEVGLVVVNGIEEEYYHYLRWKRVEVIDQVMGPVEAVLARLFAGELAPGDILYARGDAS